MGGRNRCFWFVFVIVDDCDDEVVAVLWCCVDCGLVEEVLVAVCTSPAAAMADSFSTLAPLEIWRE